MGPANQKVRKQLQKEAPAIYHKRIKDYNGSDEVVNVFVMQETQTKYE